MKVYLTKYALTSGIEEIDVTECGAGLVSVKGSPWICYGGKEWQRTKDEATARAEEMKSRKIASLLKQLAKLRAMKFDI